MQVITWNSGDNDGVAIYLFEDEKEIIRTEKKTTINDANGNPELIISDVNINNSNVIQNAIEPEDYYGYKYTYIDDTFTPVPDWVDPRLKDENLGD